MSSLRVEIVEHEINDLGAQVSTHEAGEVGILAMSSNLHDAACRLRRHGDECAASSAAPIIVILLRWMAGPHCLDRICIGKKLQRLLVEANYRLAIAARLY